MLNRVLPVLFLATLLQACTAESQDTAALTAVGDSLPVETAAAAPVPAAAEAECVFDTNTYQFTTRALRKHKLDQRYIWDTEQKRAVAPLANGDTLILRIGGCDHFSYLASYRTDSAKFNQEVYLFDKVRWLAETYFDDGFDQDYSRFIANKQYQLEQSATGFRLYSVASPDTAVTNRVCEGFYFKKAGGRTEIWIHGYVN